MTETATMTAIPLQPPLVVNGFTKVIHRHACRYKGSGWGTWAWALDKTLAEVIAASEHHGWVHLCGACMPGLCRCEDCQERGTR